MPENTEDGFDRQKGRGLTGAARDGRYRVVTVNLNVAETAWLDDVRQRLKRKGLTKVTRSELVRLAVGQLQGALRDRSDTEMVEFFLRALQNTP